MVVTMASTDWSISTDKASAGVSNASELAVDQTFRHEMSRPCAEPGADDLGRAAEMDELHVAATGAEDFTIADLERGAGEEDRTFVRF